MRGPRNILNNNGGGGGNQTPSSPPSPPPTSLTQPTNTGRAVTQKSNQSQVNSAGNGSRNVIQGIVRSIVSSTDGKGKIGRILGAFSGCPYSLDGVLSTIQVDLLGSNSSSMVIVYGSILNGAIVNGNTITVEGKPDSNNRIIARGIFNDTAGCSVPINRSVSPGIVVLGIAAVIALLAILIMTGIAEAIIKTIIGVAILLVVLYIIFKIIKFKLRG